MHAANAAPPVLPPAPPLALLAARRVGPFAAALALVCCTPVSYLGAPRAAFGEAVTPAAEATAAALAGDWSGRYDAPLYDRHGEIRLSLRRVAGNGGGGTPSTLAGTVFISGVAQPARDGRDALDPAHARDRTGQATLAVDSARAGGGRVVLWLRPYADEACGCTVQLRLDGALAADTLGGRLRADVAPTVAAEHRGGWRVVRTARAGRVSP